MLVVIPVCEKDVRLALKNLAWLKKLGQKPTFDALVSCETGFDGADVAEAAASLFTSVKILNYEPWTGEKRWPTIQNWAWQQTARNVFQPWLWWEADATPLRADWLETLLLRYIEQNKPFLGASAKQGKLEYMAGVGIYPPYIEKFSVPALLARDAAFDVVLGQSVFPHKVTVSDDLIKHVPTIRAHSFQSAESAKIMLPETAILFHPCKDGSLIDVLCGKKSASIKVGDHGVPAFPLRCRLDDFTGYGQVSTELVLHLLKIEEKEGFRLELYPEVVEYKHSKVPKQIELRIAESPKVNPHRWELILYTLVVAGTRLKPGLETLFFTMWESSRVPEASMKMLNECAHVIVPNQWFASCLTAQGLKKPVHLVPLGIEIENYPVHPMPDGPFTIGTAGRYELGGIRKGVNLIYEAFRMAFGSSQDVRLRIKCTSTDQIKGIPKDKRVDIIRKHLTPAEMSAWYESLHVYASGSACEGWGRHQHEAMSTGRPVLGVNFGGITEFWNPSNGYAVQYDIREGEGVYAGNGCYAWPRVESMAEEMLMAKMGFDKRKTSSTFQNKSLLSCFAAQQFPSSNMAAKLVKMLKEQNYI